MTTHAYKCRQLHMYKVPHKLMYLIFKDTKLNISAVLKKYILFCVCVCVMCCVIVVVFFACPQFWQWNHVGCPLCFLGMQKISFCYNSSGKWCQMWFGTKILFLGFQFFLLILQEFSVFWKRFRGCRNLKELWRRVTIARICFCDYSKLLHWGFFFAFLPILNISDANYQTM